MLCWKIINPEKNTLKHSMGNYGHTNSVTTFLETKFHNSTIPSIGTLPKTNCAHIDENVNPSK